MNVKPLIIFDVDMTLIDTAGAGRESFRRTWLELLPEVQPPRVQFAGRTDPLIVASMVEAAGLNFDAAELESFITRFREIYLSKHLPQVVKEQVESGKMHLLPGARKLVEHLYELQVPLALLTGNWQEGARIKLEPFGLWKYFPVGAFGSDSADRNSLPPIAISRAIEHYRIKFKPDQCWLIGDSVRDAQCATQNGLNCLGVTTGYDSAQALQEAGATATVKSLDPIETVLEILLK